MHPLHAVKTFVYRFLPKAPRNGDFRRHRRYQVEVVNLSSLATVFRMRGGKASLWAMAAVLFLLIGIFWVWLVIYTPVRNILPLKMQADLRDEYVDLSLRIDSVAAAASTTDRYAQNILSILRDSVPLIEYAQTQAVEQQLTVDSLIEASEAERSFVQRFEANERYNLSVLSPIAAEGMTFYPPVRGVIPQEKTTEGGIPQIVAEVGASTPVSAVYSGTVLNVYFTTGKGITVVIQHPNDFVSEYSGLAEVFVRRGDKVNAGTRLGLALQNRYPLVFELWHNGSPLPPTEYIPF